MNIASTNIDNVSVRKVLLSSALLQAQVVSCCCKQATPPPTGTLTVTQSAVGNTNPTLESLEQTISVVVTSSVAATNVAVTVTLTETSPNAPAPPGYDVIPGPGWSTAAGVNLTQLAGTIPSLAANQPQTLTFEVNPTAGLKTLSFTITSLASAAAAGFTTAQNTLVVNFGVIGSAGTQ